MFCQSLLYQGDSGRPRARHMLIDMSTAQRRLHRLFSLDAYALTRLILGNTRRTPKHGR